MFGYVTVFKPELKIKDYYQYKAYYCGLCRVLREKYGITGQLTLTYDMTFAIILLTSLYESRTKLLKHRCAVHPVKKIPMLVTEMTVYAAQMNIVLSYYHLLDNWKDEKSVPGLVGSRAMRKKAVKIEKQYPRQCKKIQECLRRLQQLEAENCDNIDETAGCFGELMAELMVYQPDIWEDSLRKIGFYLGKFIYIMDAYDDIEKDIKKNCYNPLKKLYGQPDYEAQCRQMLTMMMAECSAEFEKLPCLEDAEILRNILYAGVWGKYNNIQKEKFEREEKKS